MFCNYCGLELPDDSCFCSRCGKRLPNMSLPDDVGEEGIEWDDMDLTKTLSAMSSAITNMHQESRLIQFQVDSASNFVLPTDMVEVYYQLENSESARLYIKNGEIKKIKQLNLKEKYYCIDFSRYQELAPKVEVWIEFGWQGNYSVSEIVTLAIADQFDKEYYKKLKRRENKIVIILIMMMFIGVGLASMDSILGGLIAIFSVIVFALLYLNSVTDKYQENLRKNNIAYEPINFKTK